MSDIDIIERGIHEIAKARRVGDPVTAETARLADKVAGRFREEFGSELDMETCGKAMIVAAASIIPLIDPEIPAAVLSNLIGMAGENLVRHARQAPAGGRVVPGTVEYFAEPVLTWHPLDLDADPVEVPLDTHWVFPADVAGEFRLSTREVPEVSGG